MPTFPLLHNGSPAAVTRLLAMAALLAVVAACASSSRAPVEERGAVPPRTGSILAAPLAPAASPRAGPGAVPGAGAEPDWRPATLTVKRGDTLHQIALDYGLDYRELAAWNNLDNPNLILVGQVLRLTGSDGSGAPAAAGVTVAPLRTAPPVAEAKPADVKLAEGKLAEGKLAEGKPTASPPPVPAAAPATVLPRNSDTYKTLPKAVRQPYSERAMREVARAGVDVPAVAEVIAAPVPVPVAPASRGEQKPESAGPVASSEPEGDEKLNWVWPSKGKIVGNFSETANLKGIDIAGTAGQPVVASAGGTVVYAGTGLRGYGKLIIVKHNKTYLSAYAHNREILVKEGQVVGRGEKIAEMGNSDTADVKLHFEIRRLGKPMDPARYLPPA